MNETDAGTKDRERNIPVIVTGILCAVAAWFFGFRPFLVNGVSMYPTFNASFTDATGGFIVGGDYLIVDIFSYLFLREPERFDVVVVRSPVERNRYLLKRIIGLPNEEVNLSGEAVEITKKNGTRFTLREPYLADEKVRYTDQVTRLGDEQYFLLGDNRSNSLDSRVWGGLADDNIVGRVILRLYPFEHAEKLPGHIDTRIPEPL